MFPGSQSPRPVEPLSSKSNGNAFGYNIWSLILSFWICFRGIKVKQVSCYSLISFFFFFFTMTGFMLMMTFGKHLRMGWLPGKPAMNRGMELSAPLLPPILGEGEGAGDWTITNSQWFINCVYETSSFVAPTIACLQQHFAIVNLSSQLSSLSCLYIVTHLILIAQKNLSSPSWSRFHFFLHSQSRATALGPKLPKMVSDYSG